MCMSCRNAGGVGTGSPCTRHSDTLPRFGDAVLPANPGEFQVALVQWPELKFG